MSTLLYFSSVGQIIFWIYIIRGPCTFENLESTNKNEQTRNKYSYQRELRGYALIVVGNACVCVLDGEVESVTLVKIENC